MLHFKIILRNILFLLLFSCAYSINAQTIEDCDTLLQKGVVALQKQNYVKSLEFLTQAKAIAEKKHWYKQLFLANNNIGNNYYSMLLYGEALDYYLESYSIAVKHLDPQKEMIVLNNIAIIYSKEDNYEKAKDYFKKAYDIAKDGKQYQKVALYAMNLGNLANDNNKPVEGKRYITEALPYIKNDPDMMVMAQIGLAENDLLTGNAKRARENAESIYHSANNLKFNSSGPLLLVIITRGYLQEKNYPMALEFAHKALKLGPNEEIKKGVFELLAEIYSQSGKLKDALIYKDSVIATIADIEKIKNTTLLNNNQVKFELLNYKNQLAIKDEKSRAEHKIFYYVLAVSIGIAIIIVLTLLNILAKHKQKKLVAERNQKATALELEKEKNENLILENQIHEKDALALKEQQRLRDEIEERNRKLSAKALYLNNRNHLIEEVITSLSKIPELSKNVSLDKHIKTLKSQLKTEDEWDSFLTHFEEVNHGLISQIKILHPSLTANDIRFISYIYMNMSTKEIATLLNISEDACRKRKERISSKMGLPENVQLYSYLSSIEEMSH